MAAPHERRLLFVPGIVRAIDTGSVYRWLPVEEPFLQFLNSMSERLLFGMHLSVYA